MHNSTWSGSEPQLFGWMNRFSIFNQDEIKISINGTGIIIQELKFYRYPLNQKVIFEDSDLFRVDDGKFEFSDSYFNSAGISKYSAWGK